MGYDAQWGVLGAIDAGAPHERERMWVVAHSKRQRLEGSTVKDMEAVELTEGDWWDSEPNMDRVAYGVAARVDRLRCIGNGQVPAVAALAWRKLNSMIPWNQPEEDR
jgi:DNA (cytosine-5)-methyltransferase 1